MRALPLLDEVQEFIGDLKGVQRVQTFHQAGKVTSGEGLIVDFEDGSLLEISFYLARKSGSAYPCRDCKDVLHTLEELAEHRRTFHSKESKQLYYYLEILGKEPVGLYRRERAGVMPRAKFNGTVIALNRFQFRVLRQCELDLSRIPPEDRVGDVQQLLKQIEEGRYVHNKQRV